MSDTESLQNKFNEALEFFVQDDEASLLGCLADIADSFLLNFNTDEFESIGIYIRPENRFPALDPKVAKLFVADIDAEILRRLGRREELFRLMAALDDYPDNEKLNFRVSTIKAYGKLGLTTQLFETGNPQQALRMIDEAIEHRSDIANLHDIKAAILLSINQPALAMASVEKAVRLDDCDSSIYQNGAAALFAMAYFDEAIEWAEKALRIDPLSGAAWYNLGSCLLMLDQKEKALAAFKRSLHDEEFKSSNPYVYIAAIESSRKRYNEALQATYKGEINGAEMRYLYYIQSVIFFSLDNLVEARSAILSSISLEADYSPAWYVLAKINMQENRKFEAQECLDKFFFLGAKHHEYEALQCYKTDLNAPFFVIDYFEKNPELLLIESFLKWYNDLSSLYIEDIRYAKWLSGKTSSSLHSFECDRELAILNFFRGNTIAALNTLDRLDRENENDLKSQYYFLLAKTRLAIAADELECIIENAVDLSNNALENELSEVITLYYAGHIFALAERWSDAEKSFGRISDDYLPALYMQFWCSIRQNLSTESLNNLLNQQLKPETNLLLQKLLDREESIWEQNMSGSIESFVGYIQPADWSAESKYWKQPWLKYQNFIEISDPLSYFSKVLEDLPASLSRQYQRVFDANRKSLPAKEKPYVAAFVLSDSRNDADNFSIPVKPFQLTWEEREHLKTEHWKNIIANPRIDVRSVKLFNSLDKDQNLAAYQNHTLFILSSQIDNKTGTYHTECESYLSFIDYLHLSFFIDDYTFLTATCYLIFRASAEFGKMRIEAIERRFNSLMSGRGVINRVMRYSGMDAIISDFTELSHVLISEKFEAIVTDFGPQAVKRYVKELLAIENAKIEDINYETFRANFYQFIINEKERLGLREFSERYRFNQDVLKPNQNPLSNPFGELGGVVELFGEAKLR
ncbi:tetratricopeptide repeat protein [Dyadobacter aurulentus]|uniref:tetratricopeptide repeat protein n=1 Tax=Dyadobacter sp. UC 10 TaxID=2605428 RepID=UPI0011F0A687|nr:tetratricopeptide repeat protein [Dyadobacter sp. UC 10]KAA0992085.1 tetratricopeptide repeat protein [Dyadobacter sp. UC 10]